MPADPKHNPDRNPAVLVEVTRGPIVKSAHFGAIAVADAKDHLLAWAGNPGTVAYYRSSCKPILAVPLVETGAADHFGFTEREIAIICGSHGGEAIHVETVLGILDKIGLGPDALACGTHMPLDKAHARHAGARRAAERPPPQLLGQARRYVGACSVSMAGPLVAMSCRATLSRRHFCRS